MNILIVEDFRPMAKGFSEVLREQGHQVQSVVGFCDIETLQAVDIDGKVVTVTGSDFDLALVDGQLEQFNGQPKQPIEGPAVVARLVKDGVKCFGISTVKDLNDAMLSNGAVAAANKAIAFCAFVGDLVSAETVIASTSLAVQALNEFQVKFTTEACKPLRRRCDEIITRLM